MSQKVYFDIAIDDTPQGKIVFQLFDETVPKTARNFRELCTGKNGFGYKDSIFHRVIPKFMIQGGDITNQNGIGGKSIYGKYFQDQSFQFKHNQPYLLSMANCGKNTNSSQFFITTVPCPWLDGKHVVFGKVTQGKQIVHSIQSKGQQSGKTTAVINIADCGIYQQ